MLKLMEHQQEAVRRGGAFPRYGIGHEPGLGKTIATLAIVADQKAKGYTGRTLVLCPKSIMWSAWANDAKHFPTLSVQVCWAETPAKRKKLIDKPADIYIINPASFKRHYDDFLAAGVTRLIVDESSCLKDHESQISIACYQFSRQCDSVYLLSGTPNPNGDHEFYGQVRCIDPTVFGPSFWKFAYRYFVPQKRVIQGKERIIGWKPNEFTRVEFVEKLRSVWWTLKASECLDLPDETDSVREIELSPDEQRVYDALLDELAIEFENGEVTQFNANAKTMKLRQAVGGNLYDGAQVRRLGTSKLDALDELLVELGHASVVIWAEFTAEIDLLVNHLSDQGCNVGRIDGLVPADVRASLIADFQAGRLQYMVCHPAAAGHGITLTAARYDVFYSLSFSSEQHEQARKRIHRTGQKWPVVHHYLIARGTIDEKLRQVLTRKASSAEAMKELLTGYRKNRHDSWIPAGVVRGKA